LPRGRPPKNTGAQGMKAAPVPITDHLRASDFAPRQGCEYATPL